MLEYGTLRIIWWLLLGILLIGFAIMDGFDLGALILLPFIGKKDIERRAIINAIGPTWEGNQVWFILGGGAIFAAWPDVYATSFSGFYLAMLIILLALILRPVGFKFRSKMPSAQWRSTWDVLLFIGGFIPALIFGVAVGNVIQGVPFYYTEDLQIIYSGSFWGLLNPFALLCGLLSVTMLTMHGANFLALKTEEPLTNRANKIARLCSLLVILLFALASLWVFVGIKGYLITSKINPNGPSNPLLKQAIQSLGAWNHPLLSLFTIAPLLGFLGAAVVLLFARVAKHIFLWLASSISILGIIATVGLGMFPFILPSSLNPKMSLTVWDASSSKLTLEIMLFTTVIFMPIIISYTSWVYYVLRGKIKIKNILNDNSHTMY